MDRYLEQDGRKTRSMAVPLRGTEIGKGHNDVGREIRDDGRKRGREEEMKEEEKKKGSEEGRMREREEGRKDERE